MEVIILNSDRSKLIISTGVIIFLIIITWTIMGWPLDVSNIYFWLFILIGLLEAIIVIVINEYLYKKKKRRDNKKLQKINNILLIIIFVLGGLIILCSSGAIWYFSKLNQYNDYPNGTMSYTLEDYNKELLVPSYSIIVGEYWDELIVFRTPKSTEQITEELNSIFTSDPFIRYETNDGYVYYNSADDYTITNYEVYDKLFMNTFNLVYCDGLCN